MSKIDELFHGIISFEEMASKFEYNPDDYPTIAKGEKSTNKYVRAIAKMLIQYDKEIVSERMAMRIKNLSGTVHVPQEKIKTIYNKLAKELEL